MQGCVRNVSVAHTACLSVSVLCVPPSVCPRLAVVLSVSLIVRLCVIVHSLSLAGAASLPALRVRPRLHDVLVYDGNSA